MIGIVSAVSNDIVIDNRVHKIALSLNANGYKVTIVGRQLKKSQEIHDRAYTIKRFKLWFNKGPLFYLNLNFRLFVYLLFSKASIILANDLDTLLGCYLASSLRRKKLGFDSHELFPEVPELVERPRIRKIWLFLEKHLIRKIDFGFTVSNSIAEFYQKTYGVHFEVIRNVSQFKSDREFEGLKKDESQTIIIYQGSLNIGRGLDLAIQGMNFIENAILWIIGAGDIERELRKLVSDLKLTDKILFKGRVALEDLWSYTPRADIGISLEENLGLNYKYALPNKLFDYIQARLPVIVSDLPEISVIVEKYQIGKVLKVRTPENLAAVINDMIRHVLPYGIYNTNLEFAARELCWEREEEKLITLFKRSCAIDKDDIYELYE